MMRIIKHIPARTKVYEIEWCNPNFITVTDNFKKIRSEDSCFMCSAEFSIGDSIGLACFIGGALGNKMLCHTCSMEILDSDLI